MNYKTGNRHQMNLLPSSIENYIGENDPVRAYDAFIEILNLEELGLKIHKTKNGRPAYDPKAMLKLLCYGYSYGWRSSRKLERAIHHNMSFIWLMSGMKPDHKTIAEFRRNNLKLLENTLKKCTRLCIQLNLIEGNILFLDGSKIRGNASINKTISKENLEKKLLKIDKKIEELLQECDNVDNNETGSLVELSKNLSGKKKLKTKIKLALDTINSKNLKKINLTDDECVLIKSRQGLHAGYNAQVVTDEKHGLIVSSDVVAKSNDMGEFNKQINNANEILDKNCDTACADAGYSDSKDLKKSLDQKIEVIVPSQKQALHKKAKDNPFSKDKFTYDKNKNCYICPENNTLAYKGYNKESKKYCYLITKAIICSKCNNYGVCTTAKRGRSIIRLEAEETKEYIENYYITEKAQAIYKKRKEKVELQFGHIKRNLNGGHFLLRGLNGANAEMSINSTCFNLVRMIKLLGGVRTFINQINEICNKNGKIA